MLKKYQIVIENDTDSPENNGEIVLGAATLKEAQAFLAGARFVGDSALTLKIEAVDLNTQ